MNEPPGQLAETRTGGNTTGRQALTGSQLEAAVRAAHKVLADCGVTIGPSRVAKIVRRFSTAIARHGMTFHEFLSDEANLTSVQRHTIIGHPEWFRVIAYADPTGETAVNNVLGGHRP